MQILASVSTVGASLQIGKMIPLCDFFFDCPVLSLPFSRSYAQVEPLDRFHALWLKRRAYMQGWSFGG